jgi:hypothetical protein
VVTILDTIMATGAQSPPVSTLGVGEDGGTNVTDLVRSTLGDDIEAYRSSSAWRGVLEELNGITSTHILELLTVNHLCDIINIPVPPRLQRAEHAVPNDSGLSVPAADARFHAAGSAQGAANRRGALSMQARLNGRSFGRNAVAEHGMVGAVGGWNDNLVPGGDEEMSGDQKVVVVSGNEGMDRHGVLGAAGDAAKITMLLHSIDHAPELGHVRLHSMTSNEDSEMFEDAKEQLMSDDSFFTCAFLASVEASLLIKNQS